RKRRKPAARWLMRATGKPDREGLAKMKYTIVTLACLGLAAWVRRRRGFGTAAPWFGPHGLSPGRYLSLRGEPTLCSPPPTPCRVLVRSHWSSVRIIQGAAE